MTDGRSALNVVVVVGEGHLLKSLCNGEKTTTVAISVKSLERRSIERRQIMSELNLSYTQTMAAAAVEVAKETGD